MDKVERFGVSMPEKLVKDFDAAIGAKGYKNRSEAIRDIVRNYLVEEDWSKKDCEVVGTLTIVYDHHKSDLQHEINHVQHEHTDCVVCSQHVHMDKHNCLETIVLKGMASDVQRIADSLISTRGVKHGRLICTTTGSDLI